MKPNRPETGYRHMLSIYIDIRTLSNSQLNPPGLRLGDLLVVTSLHVKESLPGLRPGGFY